jgi:hypothetical protein
MAVAILAANCEVLTAAAPDQYANVVPEVVPSLPPLRSAPDQVKFDIEFPSAMLSPLDPATLAVTATTAPAEVAVTPAAAGQAAIDAARFDARVVVLLLVAKVPVVELVQVFVPEDPTVTVPHENRPVLFDAPTARNGPGIGLVTVNVPAEPELAVNPTAG